MPPGKPPEMDEEAIKWLADHGIEVDSDGYQKAAAECPKCGWRAWVKITRKPFRWQSDVTITTFHYKCKFCPYEWTEKDSD